MFAELDSQSAQDFGTALLLGAMLGVEREKRIADDGFGIAGLRSFVLFAQAGAVAGYLSRTLAMPWIVPAVLLAIAAVVMVGYQAATRAQPRSLGLTTELAALITVLLGAMATSGHRELAIGLGVVTAALLAYKQPLHGLVGKIGWSDVLVGLRFLLAAFIVLPLLPPEPVDPWGAINLYKLWLLVLLISGLSLVGYVATRWLGSGHGIAITAASGGLVSSTAVTLALVKQSREPGGDARQLAGGILLAWGVMFGRVVVAAAIVDINLLRPLMLPFVLMLLVCAGFAWHGLRARADAAAASADPVPLRNPFSLWAASKFGLLFAAVLLLLELGQHYLPRTGVYLIAALAGLTDVDAITLSTASLANGGLSQAIAGATILAAVASNTAVKTGVAFVTGGRALGRQILKVHGATLLAGIAVMAALWFGAP